MPKPIISVENLSKAYRIGAKEEMPDTLMAAAKGMFCSPFANFKKLRSLDTGGARSDSSLDAEDPEILWALRDVSFEVDQGQVLGVIGPNGAGKSTLLKLLSRIAEPTSGRAIIRGRVSSLLEVGTGFHPELTGRENVYMNGTILGMSKREIDRKFDEIVEFSGVEKHLDTPTKRYSSGMQVRLAFSVAAHLEPEILIVDEVLAVGDSEFQKKCLGKMQDVSQGGRTVLFVSHNMAAHERLCNRCILLKNGRFDSSGEPSAVIQDYLAKDNTRNGYWELGCDANKRNGTGEARFQSCETRDQTNAQSWSIRTGEGLILLPVLHSTMAFDRIAIVATIYDANGSVVFHTNSRDELESLPSINAGGTLAFPLTISPVNLNAGTYVVDIAAQAPPTREPLDFVRGQISFQVERQGVAKSGVVLLDTQWQPAVAI